MKLFYKPEDAWAGDFIPFFKDGEFRLFYLKDWRNPEKYGEGTPWYQIGTTDFVNFTEYGEVLARGTKNDQDLYVFTGSVIEAEGVYHIFYTGFNPYFGEEGKPMQGIMHAVSNDLLNWRKIPEDTFHAPQESYEANDWRDPFVFWDEESGEYHMLLAARLRTGPSRRRGCIALCVSKDLKKWEVCEPFFAPGLYFTHECPDLFKMGEWWYLVFSTFTDKFVTHYRMSKSQNGPWLAPYNDTFDGRAFYAAKTRGGGNKRYAFGWNPTREQEKDYKPWQWGGSLVVHEIVQEHDGTLSVKSPETVDKVFSREHSAEFTNGLGKWVVQGKKVSLDTPESFGCAAAGKMPAQCKIEMSISFKENTRGCGIMLKASDDFEQAYYIRIEPQQNRLVFDSWPKPFCDSPFMIETERPVSLLPEKAYEIKVFIDGTICEVYLDEKVAMSARLYDLLEGRWGVFVNEGCAVFDNINIFTIE